MVLKRKRVIPKQKQQKPKTFVIVSFGLLLFYVIYQLASNVGIPDFFVRCPKKEFVEALSRSASPDEYVVLAMVDSSFADMAINLYKGSFEPNIIDNFLFIGASRSACDILWNESLPCYHYAEDKAASVASTYRSPDFIRKMNIRTEMILDALAAGFTVVHTDLDVVFFRNPLPELKVIMEEYDIAALWDSFAYNAGFVIIKPTWYSKKVYQHVKSITDSSQVIDDQKALNEALSTMKRSYREFHVAKLDKSKYLCGLDYFENGKRLFPKSCSECMVVHNNWIVSKEAKVYRFKEHMMWMYDKEGYYSNASTNYITFSNPIVWPSKSDNDIEELETLKGALALSEMLGRKLILPRFHCSVQEKSKSKLLPFKRPIRNPTKPQFYDCPLNSLLNISAFDSVFGDDYRENSFLKHPLVPEEVKQNRSKEIVIITLVNARLFQQNILPTVASVKPGTSPPVKENFELIDMSSKQIVMEEDVKAALSSFTEKVLIFRSLYRLMPTFSEASHQEQFQKRVKIAFMRSTYRQLP